MRDLIRRSTTKQLFLSKTEIKQTNEKATITVYIFNRETQYIIKRMFATFNYFRKWLISKKIISIVPRPRLLRKYGKGRDFKNELYSSLERFIRILSKKGVILKGVFNKKIKEYIIVEKKLYVKNTHILYWNMRFYFFILSFLDIHSVFLKKKMKVNGKNKKIKESYLTFKGNKIFDLKQLIKNPMQLNQYLLNVIVSKLEINIEKIEDAINIYRKETYQDFSNIFFKHIKMLIFYYKYLGLIKQKLKEYIPYLQLLLTKIYNKKVEVNIVIMRYIHLNTDTLLQAMAVKLRNRKSKITRVLRKSLSLIRIKPRYKTFLIMENQKSLINKKTNYMQLLQTYKGLSIDTMFNYNNVFCKLSSLVFSNPKKKTLNESNKFTKNIYSQMEGLKYKWVTGVCLLANGRLTKRYTASRAVHKTRYRGSLRNFDFLQLNSLGSNPNAALLRGKFRANAQDTFVADRRRIGSFGIKGWISGY